MTIKVDIFTDGACRGNPGPGGWAALLRYGDTEKMFSGAERQSTNNRMELTAAIEALEQLKGYECVEIDELKKSNYIKYFDMKIFFRLKKKLPV